MTDSRSLERTLLDNLPWNKARIKFVARFLLAFYAMRTVNLSILATAFSGQAKEESDYKRLQRFMREFEMTYAQLALFIVKLLGVPGPYTLALDRTNWKVGAVDLNILMLSIVYRGIGIPVVWIVLSKSGASNTSERITVMEIFLDLFGAQNVAWLLGDREFVGSEWFCSTGGDSRCEEKSRGENKTSRVGGLSCFNMSPTRLASALLSCIALRAREQLPRLNDGVECRAFRRLGRVQCPETPHGFL
jgi:hypothetical protein